MVRVPAFSSARVRGHCRIRTRSNAGRGGTGGRQGGDLAHETERRSEASTNGSRKRHNWPWLGHTAETLSLPHFQRRFSHATLTSSAPRRTSRGRASTCSCTRAARVPQSEHAAVPG